MLLPETHPMPIITLLVNRIDDNKMWPYDVVLP